MRSRIGASGARCNSRAHATASLARANATTKLSLLRRGEISTTPCAPSRCWENESIRHAHNPFRATCPAAGMIVIFRRRQFSSTAGRCGTFDRGPTITATPTPIVRRWLPSDLIVAATRADPQMKDPEARSMRTAEHTAGQAIQAIGAIDCGGQVGIGLIRQMKTECLLDILHTIIEIGCYANVLRLARPGAAQPGTKRVRGSRARLQARNPQRSRRHHRGHATGPDG